MTDRITCQKEAILSYLGRVKTHPTAEEVYLETKKKLPRISRGTVYRILGSLKEKGEIQEIPAEVSHYDGEASPHAHFICQDCYRIFDIPLECSNCDVLKKKRTKAGKINKFNIYFYGLCQKCQKGKTKRFSR